MEKVINIKSKRKGGINMKKNINIKSDRKEVLRLKRYSSMNVNINEMIKEINLIESFLSVDVSSSKFKYILKEILNFQDIDGSFKIIDNYDVPADARYNFCHYPTWLCTAFLIRAYLNGANSVSLKKLNMALECCCFTNLQGHGYEYLQSQVKILKIFIDAGLSSLLKHNDDICPKFIQMINSIITSYKDMIVGNKCSDILGKDYKAAMQTIVEQLS